METVKVKNMENGKIEVLTTSQLAKITGGADTGDLPNPIPDQTGTGTQTPPTKPQ